VKHFKAIAAMSGNRVIGAGPRIPWHLPDDFRWFKKTTMGHTLVMGRRTFESIGRALPGRHTVVLSRSGFAHPDVRTVADLRELDIEQGAGEFFICGGAEIYALALPFCSDLYLTHVKRVVEGDVFFPAFEDRFQFVEQLLDHPEFRIVHYQNPTPLPLVGIADPGFGDANQQA
jgi:dihydrofolate reductase